MIKIEDLIGKKFGKLTIIEKSEKINIKGRNRKFLLCKCECGNIKSIRYDNLKSGTKSCGCITKKRLKDFKVWLKPKSKINHNSTKTRLYSIWKAMKYRCFNKNSKNYYNYGGRGITVCNEWKNNFIAFKEWAINNGYNDLLTIDRINNYLGYYPENCRWVSLKENNKNKRNQLEIIYKDKKIKDKDFAKALGINLQTIKNKLNLLFIGLFFCKKGVRNAK